MRTPEQIHDLILDFAISDERIISVLLNGSRANPDIKPDRFQDFDILFVVREFERLVKDHSWINGFGDKLLWQLPDQMSFGAKAEAGFSYLMLFEDGNRIDLTLFPVEKLSGFKMDSLTIVWLDKEGLFPKGFKSSDKDHHISKPTEKEFIDVCNEFWWVSTYVAKGLARNEITYPKEMMETVVRIMFMKVVAWKIGGESDFSVSFGKGGKYAAKYLARADYDNVLATYSDSDIANNWKSLFVMTELFERFAKDLARRLKFQYNTEEGKRAVLYLTRLYKETSI